MTLWASSWMAVLRVCAWDMPFWITMRLGSDLEKNPFAPPGMSSNETGYLLTSETARMAASYRATPPVSSSTPKAGSSLPSVWLTSNTVARRKPASLRLGPSPALPSSASPTSSPSPFTMTTTGLRILMPRSPFLTCLPNLSCQAR